MEKNLRKIIQEEVSKVIKEDNYDYAAEEREYWDKEYYQQEQSVLEAEISTALSFMQDIHGSLNKMKEQKKLKSTNSEVDVHLDEAISHIKEAIQSYFKTLSPEVKEHVVDRLGEVNTSE